MVVLCYFWGHVTVKANRINKVTVVSVCVLWHRTLSKDSVAIKGCSGSATVFSSDIHAQLYWWVYWSPRKDFLTMYHFPTRQSEFVVADCRLVILFLVTNPTAAVSDLFLLLSSLAHVIQGLTNVLYWNGPLDNHHHRELLFLYLWPLLLWASPFLWLWLLRQLFCQGHC